MYKLMAIGINGINNEIISAFGISCNSEKQACFRALKNLSNMFYIKNNSEVKFYDRDMNLVYTEKIEVPYESEVK